MIEVKNVNKNFGQQRVLKDISAVFEAGKTNLIIGISGSGKTVLMKCMVGLLIPDAGEILYHDKNFYSMEKTERKKIQREIGMLFQGAALFDSMTVEENVMLPLNMFSD
ncbi:MAG: ATP-binding cassette domain-containing protein, partial [Fimbriimonadaceae bacterium]|nr:ATP-binding cassette domain-containing protein [Chitinophagales bacterium]